MIVIFSSVYLSITTSFTFLFTYLFIFAFPFISYLSSPVTYFLAAVERSVINYHQTDNNNCNKRRRTGFYKTLEYAIRNEIMSYPVILSAIKQEFAACKQHKITVYKTAQMRTALVKGWE